MARYSLEAELVPFVPREVQVENFPDNGRFAGVDFQALFVADSARYRYFNLAETIGRGRAVKKALAGIFLHGAQGVFCVFLALVFVNKGNDPGYHFAGCVVAGFLGNGDQFDGEFFQVLS